MRTLGEAVADRFQLGPLVGPPVSVSGGLLNRMWRLETNAGCFAVKELNLVRDQVPDFEAVYSFELAAGQAGVPLPTPVPDPASHRAVARLEQPTAAVLVHHWAEGTPMPATPVTDQYAYRLGVALADLHSLHTDWPAAEDPPEMLTDREWATLADTARRAEMPWAAKLASTTSAFARIGALVTEWNRRDDAVVVSHRDVNPKNLLEHEGLPVIVDWETLGWVSVAHELGATAASLAYQRDGAGFDGEVFHSVLSGYRSRGRTVPEPGPHWFAALFGVWLYTVQRNIERCIAGGVDGPPADGQDLSVGDSVVRRGLSGLPGLLGRLDELTAHVTEAAYRVHASPKSEGGR